MAAADAATSLACGCTVEIIGDTLHAFPCTPEHEPTMSRAAELVAIANNIEFEMEDPT
jgi:hypothetical protein